MPVSRVAISAVCRLLSAASLVHSISPYFFNDFRISGTFLCIFVSGPAHMRRLDSISYADNPPFAKYTPYRKKRLWRPQGMAARSPAITAALSRKCCLIAGWGGVLSGENSENFTSLGHANGSIAHRTKSRVFVPNSLKKTNSSCALLVEGTQNG